jgi:hypothetical protein
MEEGNNGTTLSNKKEEDLTLKQRKIFNAFKPYRLVMVAELTSKKGF